MKSKKNILILGLILVVIAIGSVSAVSATVFNVTNTAEVQEAINKASNSGDEINFATSGSFSNIAIASNKSIKYTGNGAQLYGNGSADVFDISNSNGVSISNFVITVNYADGNGISGATVYNAVINNNIITNGGGGISVYVYYSNLTITNNSISHMLTHYGDGISLVDHRVFTDLDSIDSTYIGNNTIGDTAQGIFIGGNFKGTITDNIIYNTANYGIQFTGKMSSSNGLVIVNMTNNNVVADDTALQLETPGFMNVLIDSNTFSGSNYSVNTNTNFNKTYDRAPFVVTNNTFIGPWSDEFQDAATDWNN